MQQKMSFFLFIFLLWTGKTAAIIIQGELDIDSTHQFIMDSVLQASQEAPDINNQVSMQHKIIFYSHQILDALLNKRAAFKFKKEKVLSIISFHTNSEFVELIDNVMQERGLDLSFEKNIYPLKVNKPEFMITIRDSESKTVVAQLHHGFFLDEEFIAKLLTQPEKNIALYKNNIPSLSPLGYIHMDFIKFPYVAQKLENFLAVNHLIQEESFYHELLLFCTCYREFSILRQRESILEMCSFRYKEQCSQLIHKMKAMNSGANFVAERSARFIDRFLPNISWEYYDVYETEPHKSCPETTSESRTGSSPVNHDIDGDNTVADINTLDQTEDCEYIDKGKTTSDLEGIKSCTDEGAGELQDLAGLSDEDDSEQQADDGVNINDDLLKDDDLFVSDDEAFISDGELHEEVSKSGKETLSVNEDKTVLMLSKIKKEKIKKVIEEVIFCPPQYDLSIESTANAEVHTVHVKEKKGSKKRARKKESGNKNYKPVIIRSPLPEKKLNTLIKHQREQQQQMLERVVKNKKKRAKQKSHSLEVAGILVMMMAMVYSPDVFELAIALGPALPCIVSLIGMLYVSLKPECSAAAKELTCLSLLFSGTELGTKAGQKIMHHYGISSLPEKLTIFPELPSAYFTLPNGSNLSVYHNTGEVMVSQADYETIVRWYSDLFNYKRPVALSGGMTLRQIKRLVQFCGVARDGGLDVPCVAKTLERFHNDLGMGLLSLWDEKIVLSENKLALTINKIGLETVGGKEYFAEIQPCFLEKGGRRKCRRSCQHGYQKTDCKRSITNFSMDGGGFKAGEYAFSRYTSPGQWEPLLTSINYPPPLVGQLLIEVSPIPESGIYVFHLSRNAFEGVMRFYFVEKGKVFHHVTITPHL